MLGPDASQSDVYQAAVKPVVEDVLNGWVGSNCWCLLLLLAAVLSPLPQCRLGCCCRLCIGLQDHLLTLRASPIFSQQYTLAAALSSPLYCPQVQRHADGLRADRRRQDLLPQQHRGRRHWHDPPRRGRGVQPHRGRPGAPVQRVHKLRAAVHGTDPGVGCWWVGVEWVGRWARQFG